MHIELLETADELRRVAADWDRLTDGVPFRSAAWLHNWWNHYHQNLRLFVLAARDGDQLVGVAPWCSEDSGSRGRVVRFLGSGAVCSDYQTVLCRPDREDDVIAAVTEFLEHADWDLLHLDGVAASDRVIAKLVANLVENGAQVHRQPGLNCWCIPLPATWDEYLATLSKGHRKQMRQTERRVFETGRAVAKTARDPAELADALRLLIDLHQRRRISLGEPGCYACDRFRGFIQDAIPQMFAAGQCEIHWVELDNKPITAELHLLGHAVYAYQAGVDPDALDEEPGRLVTLAAVKRAIERGAAAYDFCRGDEPYKAHWRAEPQAMLDLRVVPDRSGAQIRHGVWLAGNTMKQWVKSSLNLMGMQ